MTRRYGGQPATPAPGEPTGPARQAGTTGRLVLSTDPDGLWALRWTERPAAPRPTLTPDHTSPLDEAYRTARELRDETGAAAVTVTLSPETTLAPLSATTSGGDTPTPTYEITIRCPDPQQLTAWAAQRLGVTTWDQPHPGTRIEADDT